MGESWADSMQKHLQSPPEHERSAHNMKVSESYHSLLATAQVSASRWRWLAANSTEL